MLLKPYDNKVEVLKYTYADLLLVCCKTAQLYHYMWGNNRHVMLLKPYDNKVVFEVLKYTCFKIEDVGNSSPAIK